MKGNSKPLIILLIFILVFASFIWLFTSDSPEQIAIKEVNKSSSLSSLKELWDVNQELHQKEKFAAAVRSRITTLELNDSELESVKQWLPPSTDNLNIIVIPDLSKRTADGTGSHNQLEYDTAFISQIWKSFELKTRTKPRSKDRLVIDITDECQAKGQFQHFADSLIFDIGSSRGKSTALFFKNKRNRFYKNLAGLYEAAGNNHPAANNFIPYFNKRLSYHLKESSLEDKYRNIVFILTDGYMEENTDCRNQKSIKIWNNDIALNEFTIKRDNSNFEYPNSHIKFPNFEVYVLEIDPRRDHEEGLIHWWETWLNKLGVQKTGRPMVVPHTPSTKQWKDHIDQIIRS